MASSLTTGENFTQQNLRVDEERSPSPHNQPQQHEQASNDCTLDAILVRIGQFGRFQCLNFLLLCIPMVFNAFFSISYVFTASPVVHRCNITQCDRPDTVYSEPWVAYTIPNGHANTPDSCHRYVWSSVTEPQCRADNFNRSLTETCGKDFKFRDREYTIANEFGFFCSEEWKLSMVGTVNNIGQFIGIPLGGYFSDRYGRRSMLAIGGALSALMGLARSLSTTYGMFVSFELLDMAVGSTLFPTAFLLAIELVGPRRRVAAATIITIFYSLGEALLGVLAGVFQNWRILLRVLYAPAVLQLTFLWILPESIRWLLSQGKEERAVATLKQAARTNRRPIDDEELQQLVDANRSKLALADDDEVGYPIVKACRLFWWRLLNCCLCWFSHTLIALGLSLTSVTLDGDKYQNFMYNGLVQVPALLLPLIIMDRFGRRYSLFGSMMVCGVCMIGTMFLSSDDHGWHLTLFLLGKFAITCSFQILYFFTSEIFPTMVRNSMLSLCSMVGRIGSMLAPQVPLLINYYEYAPQLLFGAFALISGLLTLSFPETANKILPTTMAEANNLQDLKRPSMKRSRRNDDEEDDYVELS